MARATIKKIYEGRITEDYLLNQVNYHYDSQSFQEHKRTVERGDDLYRGNLSTLFPNEHAIPDIPYVENKYKNALHDLSRLAREGRGAVKFIPQGDRDRDMKQARVRESINEGYWIANRMKNTELQLYLDLAGSGMMALTGFYDDTSPYPQIVRLNPRFMYPDVRNNKLHSLLYAETVKERILAREFPKLDLDKSPTNDRDGMLITYYDYDEVVEAVILAGATERQAFVQQRWPHNLKCVPVAFEALDSYDGSFHGLFDQLAGPLMVRNKIVSFLVDYLEQMAHAPIRTKNVLNADDEPGPLVRYQVDPTADPGDWVLDRLPPAAPAGAVFGLLQYMGDQEEKEALQPPARSGNVSQSIASGSFVDRTQGQLTSVVKELQDKMASLREQANKVCMKIDEHWMDKPKPLIRPVAGKTEYTPSEDIAEWYFHEVLFGAGAGLDRLTTDTRIANMIGLRLISKETARGQVDFLDDQADEPDKIQRENLEDVIFQRLAQDPKTLLSSLGKVWLEMKKKGASLDEALEKHMPEIIAAEEQARVAAAGGPAGPEPMMEAPPATEELGAGLQLPRPPLSQIIQRI